MLDCKRKFERFNLPLAVSFRPTYGATEYTVGLMKNISCSGLSIEAENFSFIKYETLEMNLKFPQESSAISLAGSVVWKRQSDGKCRAGVKIKDIPEIQKVQLLNCVKSFSNISIERFQPSLNDIDDGVENLSRSEVTGLKKKRKSSKKPRKTGYTKQFFNGGSKCKVTFRLPIEAASDARKITIVGDFNDWNTAKTPMKQVTRGDYLVTIELQSNREYRYKYLIDDDRWENDWSADKYVANDFGADDSVVVV